ncbi:NAD(P)H-dependent oxidoreductase [Desulfosporosinus sp. FKA]|uniref:flavodoxin family protein n=1 Tax=Desulfosporosinus sp. FKA TaxID=1969834 RepID=UPI000B498282|nr:NAD(P)H-dependent oxidoreductase [Desulfosporosinus sp. FKA]
MRISVLMGSPRKKDSFNICKEIEEQIKLYSKTVEFDYIFLKDYKIKDCRGCCLCFQKSENNCPCRDDDLNGIKKQLFSADALIVASPVYAYQITGQLKRFIDRMSYLFHRQEMVGKPALIVVTTDGGGSKQVYKYLKMVMSGWGLDIVGNLQIASPMYFAKRKPQGAFVYDQYYFEKKSKKIRLVSAKLLERLKATERRMPSFYDIFMFNCLRSKTYTSKVDYTYWKQQNWLDKEYFYDVKLNPFKRIFGSALKGFIHMMGAKYLKSE